MKSKLPDVDPEQVLKQLEQELERRKPLYSQANRNAFRIWSLALLVFGLFAALWMLQYLVSQVPRPEGSAQSPAQPAAHAATR